MDTEEITWQEEIEAEITRFAAELTEYISQHAPHRLGTPEVMHDLARFCVAPTDAERLAHIAWRAEYDAEIDNAD